MVYTMLIFRNTRFGLFQNTVFLIICLCFI
uniref:Uncharacterized protein n=1 Tax=Anguilla anguilla TaxID=7936 RepID=A0A0E9UB57_ANGAN